MKINTNLPVQVHKLTYVKNHHWIELEDANGNKIKLNASALLTGKCEVCKELCFASTHQGNMNCTHCGGKVNWVWSRPQLCFVAEKESDFIQIQLKSDDKDNTE